MKRFIAWLKTKATPRNLILVSLIFGLFVLIGLPLDRLWAKSAGITEAIDTRLYSDPGTLMRLAEAYGATGRRFTLLERFTFDLIWPLIYGSFLLVLSAFLIKRLQKSRIWDSLFIVIILGLGLDLLENLSETVFLALYPNAPLFWAWLCGTMTLFKWLSLSIAGLILSLLVNQVLLHRSMRKSHDS